MPGWSGSTRWCAGSPPSPRCAPTCSRSPRGRPGSVPRQLRRLPARSRLMAAARCRCSRATDTRTSPSWRPTAGSSRPTTPPWSAPPPGPTRPSSWRACAGAKPSPRPFAHRRRRQRRRAARPHPARHPHRVSRLCRSVRAPASFVGWFDVRADPGTDFDPIITAGRPEPTGETYFFSQEGLLLSTSRFDAVAAEGRAPAARHPGRLAAQRARRRSRRQPAARLRSRPRPRRPGPSRSWASAPRPGSDGHRPRRLPQLSRRAGGRHLALVPQGRGRDRGGAGLRRELRGHAHPLAGLRHPASASSSSAPASSGSSSACSNGRGPGPAAPSSWASTPSSASSARAPWAPCTARGMPSCAGPPP